MSRPEQSGNLIAADSTEQISEPNSPARERTVKLVREENGFGLRVISQNPVIVESVVQHSSAARAGIQSYDKILKINGVAVRTLPQAVVVKMIQECQETVTLTVKSPSPVPQSTTSSTSDCDDC